MTPCATWIILHRIYRFGMCVLGMCATSYNTERKREA